MDQAVDLRTTALDAIRAALGEILETEGRRLQNIGVETSLVDDLGLDSFLFVDLTVLLEEKLGVAGFPMQRWADAELERGGRFTLGSLVALCAELIRGTSEAQ